jgi:hypothetical protein
LVPGVFLIKVGQEDPVVSSSHQKHTILNIDGPATLLFTSIFTGERKFEYRGQRLKAIETTLISSLASLAEKEEGRWSMFWNFCIVME